LTEFLNWLKNPSYLSQIALPNPHISMILKMTDFDISLIWIHMKSRSYILKHLEISWNILKYIDYRPSTISIISIISTILHILVKELKFLLMHGSLHCMNMLMNSRSDIFSSSHLFIFSSSHLFIFSSAIGSIEMIFESSKY
jgi:hypothetical protein